MKGVLKLFFLVFIIFTAVSCNENNDLEQEELQEITIKFQETKTVLNNKFSIIFSDVLEDSRCPEFGTCVWEGRAVLELLLNDTDKKAIGIGNLEVGNQNKYTNSIEYKAYSIQLIDLHPKTDAQQRNKKEYIATLKIEKL